MYKTLEVKSEDNIQIITLNRKDRLNALNDQMIEELLLSLDRADQNDEVRAIVITGSGKAFCAGMELQEGENAFDASETSESDFRDIGGKVSLKVFDMRKPIIAAINGAAVGFGITFTLPMDYRVVAENAKIGFVFTQRGIVPESCSSWFLPRLVGINKALEWIYKGDIIRADEGYQAGLFQKQVPADKVLEEAKKIAKEFVNKTSPVSIGISRQLLWNMLGAESPRTAHLEESKLLYWAGNNADSKEGVEAFLEKREANFPLKISKDYPDFNI